MNFLQIGIKLKAENVQSFIDDFLKIDDIKISDIQLCDDMILVNKIKYKSFLSISLGLKIERVEDGVLSIVVKKLKAVNIPIGIIPINYILKIILNKLNITGIYSDGKKICVNLTSIFKEHNIDFLALAIKDIKITKENIDIVLDDINFDLKNLINKKDKSKNKEELNKNSYAEEEIMEKEYLNNESENVNIDEQQETQSPLNSEEDSSKENDYDDYDEVYETYNYDSFPKKEGKAFDKNSKGYFNQYSRVRRKIYEEKFNDIDKKTIGKIIFLLPDIAVLAYRLFRDGRVSKSLKILLGFTVTYLVSPWDLFNKKNSIFSKIDDGLLLIFALTKIFTSVDENILIQHFEGDEETLNFLRDTFDVLNEFLGIDRINKIYTVIEKFVR